MRAILTLFVLAVATVQQVAAQPAATSLCPDTPPVYDCTDDACVMTVQFVTDATCRYRIDDRFIAATNWPVGKGRRDRSPRETARRITEKTSLRVKVTHANHLKFAVKLDTVETVLDSYVYLERLWKQAVGLRAPGSVDPTVGVAPQRSLHQEQRFIDAVKAWRGALRDVDARVTERLARYRAFVLTPADLLQLPGDITATNADLELVAGLRERVTTEIWRSENYAVFDGTNAVHRDVQGRLDSFVTLAGYSVNGVTRPVKFGAAGRIVTTTISGTDRASGAGATELIVIEFLVHSTLPLTFHAGAVYRSGEEPRFEPAATAAAGSGSVDLFKKLNSAKPPADLTAFMSYDFSSRERVGTYWRAIPSLTLGTGLTDVGERLYLGASWRFGRAILTAGAVSLDVSEAEPVAKDVLGAVGQLTGAQELFSQVATRRRFRPFVGVSFAPF